MKLLGIEVLNFRVFYGLHELDFSSNTKESVTIITGFNGGGKTTLLNALYWGFTGNTTPRFQAPHKLINSDALLEDPDAYSYVEIKFEEDNIQYKSKRQFGPRRATSFDVIRIEKDGRATPVPNPQFYIQKFIPKGLAEWFFYDAEAIGNLQLTGSEDFKRSLRKTFGFESIDNLIEDLLVCEGRKQRELNKIARSENLDSILKDIEYCKNVIKNEEESVELTQKAFNKAVGDFERIDRDLRKHEATKGLQKERIEIDRFLDAKRQELKKLIKSRKVYEGLALPAILINQDATKLNDLFVDKEHEGNFPSDVSKLLLDRVIQHKKCICNRDVLPGSKEEESIKSLFENASTTVFNDRVTGLKLLINNINIYFSSYENTIIDFRSKEQAINKEIGIKEIRLAEIKETINLIPLDIINTLEKEREIALNERIKHENALRSKTTKINTYNEKLKNAQKLYEIEASKLGLKNRVKVDLEKIKRLLVFTRASLIKQENRALNVLRIELNEHLAKFLIKPYKAIIDANSYKITMLDDRNNPVAEGTGEGAVLKYVFLATVASLTGKNTVDKIEFTADPISAPLVLDAPFTSLSDTYKSLVAMNLVENASQLLLFVLPEVLPLIRSSIKDSIGKEYVLISRLRGDQGEKPTEEVSINNQKFVLTEYNSERNESYVKEVVV